MPRRRTDRQLTPHPSLTRTPRLPRQRPKNPLDPTRMKIRRHRRLPLHRSRPTRHRILPHHPPITLRLNPHLPTHPLKPPRHRRLRHPQTPPNLRMRHNPLSQPPKPPLIHKRRRRPPSRNPPITRNLNPTRPIHRLQLILKRPLPTLLRPIPPHLSNLPMPIRTKLPPPLRQRNITPPQLTHTNRHNTPPVDNP